MDHMKTACASFAGTGSISDMADMPLIGKVALVTGAGRGIGSAIAQKLASQGAAVYALDMPGREFDADCLACATPLCADVTDSDAARETLMRIKKEQGRLDVLVNNAAIISYEPLAMVSKEQMRRMFEVNVFAVIEWMQYASRLMLRQKSGSIINMASIVGAKGASGQLLYSAAKGAVISATLSAAKELAPQGIRVNALAPGMVATERFTAELTRFPERANAIGMGRLAQPEEIADACAFLAGDGSAYITGQVIGLDGCMAI